jgi:hypothetical protein
MRPTMYYEEGRENWIWQIVKWPNQPKKRDRADVWAYCDDAWEGLVAAMRLSRAEVPVGPLRALNKRIAQKQLSQMKKAREQNA